MRIEKNLKNFSKLLNEGGSRLRENDKGCLGNEEEIPAFAGIELNENASKYFYVKSPPIPAKAGISLSPIR
jgi:hypothetical protein